MTTQDAQKMILLQHQLGMSPDENYTKKLGAIRMPPGYALMINEVGFYYLKWDGAESSYYKNKYYAVRASRLDYNEGEKKTA